MRHVAEQVFSTCASGAFNMGRTAQGHHRRGASAQSYSLSIASDTPDNRSAEDGSRGAGGYSLFEGADDGLGDGVAQHFAVVGVLASLTDQRVERMFNPADTEFRVECALLSATFDQCDHRRDRARALESVSVIVLPGRRDASTRHTCNC
jgi:hypothetical protein